MLSYRLPLWSLVLSVGCVDALTDPDASQAPRPPFDAIVSDDAPASAQDAASPSDTSVVDAADVPPPPLNLNCVAPPKPPASELVGILPAFLNADFDEPASATFSPVYPGRIYVASKYGVVSWADAEVGGAEVALDLTDRVLNNGDMGLVSIAFDPGFAKNGWVYVAYTLSCDDAAKTGGDDVCPALGEEGENERYVARLARFTSTDDGESFDPDSEEVIFDVWQPDTDHTINQIVFDDAGMMIVAVGDGGCCGDKLDVAQDLGSLRGKILRLDTSKGGPGYEIPPDNPFVGKPGARGEVWAYGFRNPWKVSLDRVDGTMWVGDVGDDDWEEINRVERGGNYGWAVVEGPECFSGTCDSTQFSPPAAWYSHDVGQSVIGGFVYRGKAIPALQGSYLFGDLLGRQIWALWTTPGRTDLVAEVSGPFAEELVFEAPGAPVGFIEDAEGEPYLITFEQPAGFWRILPPDAVPGTPLPATLSATGCFEPDDPTQPVPALIPYAPAAPFWSDGGGKSRYMSVPEGKKIVLSPEGDFEFPTGSVLVKEFELDGVRIETRFFSRHSDGSWSGYTYRWRQDGSDADLVSGRTDVETPGLTWTIPSRGACSFCHTEVAGATLGLETRQLDVPFEYPSPVGVKNQLEALRARGILGNQTAGEVGRFLREAPTGSTATNSGEGGPATIVGNPIWKDDGLFFDGDDSMETSIPSRSEQTLSAWIHPTATSDVKYMEGIFDSEVQGMYGSGFGLDQGSLVVLLDDEWWETDIVIPYNTWTHVLVTWNRERARLYIGGVLEGDLDYEQGGVGGSNYSIGSSPSAETYFKGGLADVRVLDVYVDDAQVALIVAGDSLPVPPPKAHFPNPYDVESAPPDVRARSWLNTNCAQCHRPGGPGRYDLRFDTPLAKTGMCGVKPQHGKVGTGDPQLIAPGDPANSVVVRRIRETATDRMPPVSSHVVDEVGAALIEGWISAMSGCTSDP